MFIRGGIHVTSADRHQTETQISLSRRFSLRLGRNIPIVKVVWTVLTLIQWVPRRPLSHLSHTWGLVMTLWFRWQNYFRH